MTSRMNHPKTKTLRAVRSLYLRVYWPGSSCSVLPHFLLAGSDHDARFAPRPARACSLRTPVFSQPLPSIIILMAAHAAVQDKRVDSMPGDAMSSDQNTCGRGGPPQFGVAGLCPRSFPAGLSPLDICGQRCPPPQVEFQIARAPKARCFKQVVFPSASPARTSCSRSRSRSSRRSGTRSASSPRPRG